jgi:hypothetical protein
MDGPKIEQRGVAAAADRSMAAKHGLLAALLAVVAPSARALALTRRGLIRGVAAGIAAPLTSLAPQYARGAPTLAPEQLLADVPIFAVTNSKGAPYLTERNPDGLRTGAFYLSPRDALADLENVRAFDAKASLSILPLGTIWAGIPKSAEEAKKLAAQAEAPTAGTSTDMRLFSVRAISDEEEAVASQFGGKRPPAGAISVYWDPALLIQPEGAAEAQRPYFFRLKDLLATIQEAGSDRKPEPRVDDLVTVVNDVARAGKGKPPPLFYVASDAAAVVERTGIDDVAGAGAAAGAGGGRQASSGEDKMQRLIDLCLRAPFKAA